MPKTTEIYEFNIVDFRCAIKNASTDLIRSKQLSDLIYSYIDNCMEDFLEEHKKK